MYILRQMSDVRRIPVLRPVLHDELLACRQIIAQDGTVKNDGTRHFSPEELLRMNWLCDNIDGTIPKYDELLSFAKPMVRELGLYRKEIPPEKEDEI